MALPYQDAFTAASNSTLQAYSANWTISAGAFSVDATNDAVYPNSAGAECGAFVNSETPSANQYAQVVLSNVVDANASVGPAVRCSTDGNYYGLYYSRSGGGMVFLFKMVAGTWTGIAEAIGIGVWANGDVLRLEVEGTTLTPKRNGTLIAALGTKTDSSLASGRIGICGYDALATCRMDDFEGGNLGAVNPTVSVADSTTLSEAVTVAVSSVVSNRSVSVSDSASVSESVTARMAAALQINQTESVTVAESVAATRGAAGSLSVSVSDSVTVAESLVSRMAAALQVSRSESSTLAESVIALPIGGTNIAGVLVVDPVNGRYFRNNAGPVLLSGFHTWYEFQDGGLTYPPAAFDYAAWLDYLDARGVNLHKLWVMETARQWADADAYFDPLPYARTGPGNAADGRLKFDLTQLNQEYFDRLYQRAVQAGNRGHYVIVQLFQGWQVESKGYGFTPFAYHPYNAGNNINGIDGDTDNDGAGEETRETSFTAVFNLQKAYVAKVIDTLNSLDNVLWEISNEDTTNSVAWQHALIDYIHTYEAGKPKQHPVGMTVVFPNGNDSDLTASNAEWISPKNNNSLTPPATSGSQVVIFDTDHLVGLTTEHEWVWQSFLQGHNPAFMDVYDGALYGADMRADSAHERIRYNLGWVLDYAARIDLAGSTPQGSLSSTGYCLAKTTGVVRILAYQPSSGSFTVNLAGVSGILNVEWLRTATTAGTVQAGGTVAGGATRTLTPPWSGEDAVAFLWQSTYTVSVADSTTVSESVAVQVTAISPRSASAADSAALTELVALALTRTAAAGDNASLTEAVAALLALPGRSVGDAATVSEAAAAALGLPGVGVAETVSVGEAVSAAVQPAATRSIAAADSATVTDAPAALLALKPVAVSESVTVSEATAVVVTVEGVIYISAADAVTVDDAPVATLPSLRVGVADAVSASESVAATVVAASALAISVQDSTAASEAVARASLNLPARAQDAAVVTETIAATVVSAGLLAISVQDSATAGESLAVPPLGLRRAAGDALSVGESVAVFVAVSGAISISVSEAVAVLDAVQANGPALAVGAVDGVLLGEGAGALVRSENVLSVLAAESVTVGEASYATAALRGVAVIEAISVADVIVAYMVGAARADWTLSDSVLHKWILSNRSRL